MEIYLVRHGQSNFNVIRRCNDIPTKKVYLTKIGREQAKGAALRLKNKKVDVIFVSQMWRTYQTAIIINKYHNVKIIENKMINERKTGFNNKHYEEFLKFAKKDLFHIKPNGGESFQDEKERTKLFLQKLKKMKYGTIVIVGHEEPLKTIIGYINKLNDRKMWNLKIENGEIIKIIY